MDRETCQPPAKKPEAPEPFVIYKAILTDENGKIIPMTVDFCCPKVHNLLRSIVEQTKS